MAIMYKQIENECKDFLIDLYTPANAPYSLFPSMNFFLKSETIIKPILKNNVYMMLHKMLSN